MTDKNIRIKPYFTIIAHSPDNVELRAGVWNHVSFTVQDETGSGNLYRFIKALDGTQSVTDITKTLGLSRSQSEGIIDHLLQLNVIEKGASSAFDHYADIYAPAFKNKQRAEQTSADMPIYIFSNSLLGEELKTALANNTQLTQIELIKPDNKLFQLLQATDEDWLSNAILFEETIQQFTCLQHGLIVLALDYVNPLFNKKFNRIAHALELPWLHATIDGPFIFIGPTFEPHKTACYECFETRISMNLREFHSYQKYKTALIENKILRQAAFPMQGMLNAVLISHLTLEIVNYVLTGCCFTKNKVLSLYLPTMEITFNEFIKVSTCQNCGAQTHRDDHQFYFDVQKLLGTAL